MKNLHRRGFLALTGATLVAPALAAPALARPRPPATLLEGQAFGSRWSVMLRPEPRPARLNDALRGTLAAIDAQMSPWRDDSDISRFNRAGTGGMAVPAPLADVAGAALRLAAASGGHFDPTVGPLVARWGFGVIDGEGGDWRGLEAGPGVLSKSAPGLTLDPCGIAKGYALDRMAGLLRASGHDDFLIDLGGELLASGRHPQGRAWLAGVENPVQGGIAARVALTAALPAVATSGTMPQGYDLAGRRYSHIIAPETGLPVAGRLASVSVLGGDAMAADGWATALMAAGGVAGPQLARAHALPALFLMRADDGSLRRIITGGMDKALL